MSPEEGWGVGECGLRMKASMAFFLKDFLKMFPRADPSIEDVEGVTPLCIALQVCFSCFSCYYYCYCDYFYVILTLFLFFFCRPFTISKCTGILFSYL